MITVARKPHQTEGVEFLGEKECGLVAFEQRLGNTLVAIAAFDRLRQRGLVERLIVICPNSLKQNWHEEIKRFAGDLTVEIVNGNSSHRKAVLAKSRAAVLIVNYESARNEMTAISAALRRASCALV